MYLQRSERKWRRREEETKDQKKRGEEASTAFSIIEHCTAELHWWRRIGARLA